MNDTPLDAAMLAGIAALLDTIVPPSVERGLAGAGELIAEDIAREPQLALLRDAGIPALDERARVAGCETFAEVPPEQRQAIVAAQVDADSGFLPGLVFHTYLRYYAHPRVLEALGLPARPPFPEGYAVEPGDLSALDAVRARPPLYRLP